MLNLDTNEYPLSTEYSLRVIQNIEIIKAENECLIRFMTLTENLIRNTCPIQEEFDLGSILGLELN